MTKKKNDAATKGAAGNELYSKMTIGELEESARRELTESKSSIMAATKVLRYLQTTNRYKENVRYAKESFQVYLEDMFAVRMGTYQEWVRALPFEREANLFGVGLVAKTIKQVGMAAAKRVFDEISQLDEVKDKKIPRAKIDAIILKNQSPRYVQTIKKESTDWQAMYKQESIAHQITREKLAGAMKLIAEMEKQIERLKATASIIPQIRKMVEPRPAAQLS